MSKLDIAKFLMAAFNMVKRGDIKTLDELFKFAKQQFGQVDPSLKNQIEDTFKKGKASAITEQRTKDISKREKEEIEANKKFEETKSFLQEQMDILNERTKDISRGDPTGEKKEGIKTLLQAVKKDMEELERLDTRDKELTKDLEDALTGNIFKRPEGSKDKAKPFQTPGMPFQRENPDYRIPGGSRYAEGNLRTAIRKFLETEINEGRLTVNDKDKRRVMEYSPFTEDDPIDVFRRYYGESALDSADKMASKLEMGESFSDYERIFRENMPELKIKTEGAGQYDKSIADAEAALKQAAEDEKNLKKLEEFDVEDRTKNFKGGINRVGFAKGKIKLAQFLAGKGKDLVTEIRTSVNNIIESGDKKIDADMAVDDMLENLGVDRDTVDQKDILEAYDEAYKTLSVPPGSRGGPDDIAEPFQSAEESTGNLISGQLKVMRLAEEIQPGLFEKLTDTQLEIITKYGDMIDKNLLKNIVLDPDPNNQAAALATIEEAKVMIDKGMDVDEILRIQGEALNRRKQAEGGLSYLMGM